MIPCRAFTQRTAEAVERNYNTKKHVKVDVYMTKDDYEKLYYRAYRNNRSMSGQARIDILKGNQAQKELTLKGE